MSPLRGVYLGPFQMSMVKLFNKNRLPLKLLTLKTFSWVIFGGLKTSPLKAKCSIETKAFSLPCVLFV